MSFLSNMEQGFRKVQMPYLNYLGKMATNPSDAWRLMLPGDNETTKLTNQLFHRHDKPWQGSFSEGLGLPSWYKDEVRARGDSQALGYDHQAKGITGVVVGAMLGGAGASSLQASSGSAAAAGGGGAAATSGGGGAAAGAGGGAAAAGGGAGSGAGAAAGGMGGMGGMSGMGWMQGIGTAVSALGSLVQGEGQAQSAEYNAAVAEQNALIARQQGQVQAEAQQRQAAKSMGSMIASYGASGVQVDTGSPVDVLADSARAAELDRLNILYNAELKARGYESQATLDRSNAQWSRTSGILGAFGNAMQGYGSGKSMGMW